MPTRQIRAQRSHHRQENYDDTTEHQLNALITAAVGAQAMRDSKIEETLEEIDVVLDETLADC